MQLTNESSILSKLAGKKEVTQENIQESADRMKALTEGNTPEGEEGSDGINEVKVGTGAKYRMRLKRKHKMKNRKRSMIAKKAWKKNRAKMIKSLKKFHKSAKGKALHKAVGKFLAKKEGLSFSDSQIIRESAVAMLYSMFNEGVEPMEIYDALTHHILPLTTVNERVQSGTIDEAAFSMANYFQTSSEEIMAEDVDETVPTVKDPLDEIKTKSFYESVEEIKKATGEAFAAGGRFFIADDKIDMAGMTQKDLDDAKIFDTGIKVTGMKFTGEALNMKVNEKDCTYTPTKSSGLTAEKLYVEFRNRMRDPGKALVWLKKNSTVAL